MQFEGIVIRRTSYKQDAAMITVLTEDKLRSFLAKGVLKITSKNAPSVNLFTKSLFQTFNGKEGEWLRLGEIKASYPNISTSFEKLAVLDFISEITNSLVDSSDCKEVYFFLEKTLESINDNFSPLTAALIYFAKVLKNTGYEINSELLNLNDSRKTKIISYIFNVNIEKFNSVSFDKEEAKEIIFIITNYLNFQSQIEIKSLSLLSEI